MDRGKQMFLNSLWERTSSTVCSINSWLRAVLGCRKGRALDIQTYIHPVSRHGPSSGRYHFNIQQVANILSVALGFNLIGLGLNFPTVVQVVELAVAPTSE